MRGYTKIEAWRLADDLTVAVYERTRSFPREEIYGLTSQLRRTSYSVLANIVEREPLERVRRKRMDDIQKRADDKAWDEKQNRWISDANSRIEDGLSGDALAALHGLHVPPDDELPYDVDGMSQGDDEETLRDKIITRLIQIGDAISQNHN